MTKILLSEDPLTGTRPFVRCGHARYVDMGILSYIETGIYRYKTNVPEVCCV